MVWKIFLGYLIGLIATVVIRVVDAKIYWVKLKGIKEDILIFSLLWPLSGTLLLLFLALDKLEKRKAKKAIRVEKQQ